MYKDEEDENGIRERCFLLIHFIPVKYFFDFEIRIKTFSAYPAFILFIPVKISYKLMQLNVIMISFIHNSSADLVKCLL